MNNNRYNKQIAYWLLAGGLMVLVMVVVGGITRLTHSGLSIVTWQPIKGILPPLNQTQWQAAFEAYKQIPEYQKIHFYFTLEDFKRIYFWEYLHRIIGRSLGLLFIIPFLFFLVKGRIRNKALFKRLLLIFFLGGAQGFAGWYMVKSGLVENTSVDHLRLALHMSIAMIVLGTIFWTYLQLLAPRVERYKPVIHKSFFLFSVLLVFQIIYGGLTAGLKAGYTFPTYPKMGTRWLPEVALHMHRNMGWRAWIDFPANVQFVHRWTGLILLLFFLWIFVKHYNKSPRILRRWLRIGLMVITLQFLLGICVIIYHVPISIAVIHQLTAFVLFIIVLAICYFGKRRISPFV